VYPFFAFPAQPHARKFIDNNSVPYAERARRLNESVIQARGSRIGHVGQICISIGFSILILTGIAWFVVRVLESQ
jgi:hypothetical protein